LCFVVAFIGAVCTLAYGSGPLICGVVSCAASGQSCLQGNASKMHFPEPQCNTGLYCNSTSNTCLGQVPLGGACDVKSDSMCTGDLYCDATYKKCTAYTPPTGPTPVGGGKLCNSTIGCQYPTDSGSFSTSCPSSGVCPGNTTGNSCTFFSDNYVCNDGLFCNTQTQLCTAPAANGAACSSDIVCSNYCIPISLSTRGTCGDRFSVVENGFCADGDDCGADLYCNITSTYGTCLKVPSSSYKACASDSDCITSESCTCLLDGSAVCYSNIYAYLTSSSQALSKCASTTGCAGDDLTCLESKCLSQLCADYQNVYGPQWSDNSFGAFPCAFGSAVDVYNKCKTATSSGVAVTTTALLSATMAAFAILF